MTEVEEVRLKSDAVLFARTVLGFAPDEQQEALLRSRPSRLILNCTRQWGKSTLTAALAVHHAWSNAGSMVLVASPSERQSGEMVRKARRFAARVLGKTRGDGDNRRSVLFPNGSRIVGVPANEETVVGFSAVSLLIVDEAARAPDELWEAVTPMLATSSGSIWMLSTPLGRRGFFYETWTRGGPQWTRVMVKATECARIKPEFLEEERARKTAQRFAQDYLCEFGEDDDRLFPDDVIDRMFGR